MRDERSLDPHNMLGKVLVEAANHLKSYRVDREADEAVRGHCTAVELMPTGAANDVTIPELHRVRRDRVHVASPKQISSLTTITTSEPSA